MRKNKYLEWATFEVQVATYYVEYFKYFIQLNPNYLKDVENTLFPLFLEIYGSQQMTDEVIYTKHCFYQAANLVKKNDYGFYSVLMFDSIIKDRELLIIKCKEFGSKFRNLLQKYHLYNKDYSYDSNKALAEVVYFGIFAGNASVCNTGDYIVTNYPSELLEELWGKYSEEYWIKCLELKIKSQFNLEEPFDEITQRSVDEYKENIYPPRFLPPAENFQFFPSYNILTCSFEDYEKITVNAYRKHIKAYLNELKVAFQKHGMKRMKAEDYEQIQRLVIWNQNECKYLWEIIPYIPEFEKVDTNNERQVKSVVDVLRKSFQKFKALNLPVRPYGNKRKNNNSKNTP